MGDVWSLVRVERLALIDDLAGVSAGSWERDSLCAGWSVHDVVAHLVANAKTTRLGLVRDMARARFDFDRQTAQGVERERGTAPAETLERLRQVAHRTSTPPAPLDSRLVEEVVHGEDIRRPLGIRREYQQEAVIRSLRYQVRTSDAVGGSKKLVAGLNLRATDADLSIGEGPEVVGPALSILLAITRRVVALQDLTGPGVAALAPGRT